jgi:hypothetical protein
LTRHRSIPRTEGITSVADSTRATVEDLTEGQGTAAELGELSKDMLVLISRFQY